MSEAALACVETGTINPGEVSKRWPGRLQEAPFYFQLNSEVTVCMRRGREGERGREGGGSESDPWYN